MFPLSMQRDRQTQNLRTREADTVGFQGVWNGKMKTLSVGGRSDRQRNHAAPAPLVMEMVRDDSRGKMSEGVEGRMVWRHEISCGRYAVSGPGQERGEGPRVPERSRKEVNQLSCHCASLQPCFSPGKGELHN